MVRLVVHKPTYLPIDRVDSLLKFQTPNKHYNISKLIIGNSRAIYQLLICNGPNIHDACRQCWGPNGRDRRREEEEIRQQRETPKSSRQVLISCEGKLAGLFPLITPNQKGSHILNVRVIQVYYGTYSVAGCKSTDDKQKNKCIYFTFK